MEQVSTDHFARLTLGASGDLILIQDLEGTILFCNDPSHYGVQSSDVIGRDLQDLLAEPDAERALHENRRVLHAGKGLVVEERVEWRGATLWFSTRIDPIRDAEGRIVGTLRVARDITQHKQQETLRERERRLFRDGPAVVFRWKAVDGWPVEYVSPNVIGLFGHAANEFTSGRIAYADVVHPDDLPRVSHEVATHTAGNAAHFEQDYRIVRPFGDERWVRDYTVPVRDNDGNITHYDGYVLDITAHKHAEQALRDSEHHFRLFYEQAPVGYQSLDERGRVLEVNATWLETLGYSRADVIGRPFGDFLAPPHRAVFPRRFETFKAAGQIHGIEFEMVRRDNESRWVVFDGRIAHHPDGSFHCTHCVFHDITERKRAETTLRESEERFRAIADYTYDLETWIGNDGRLKWINPAIERILGYTPAECLAMNDYPQPLIHPDDREWHERAWHTALQQRSSGNDVPFRLCHKDGSTVWMAVSWQPIHSRDGVWTGMRCSLRDITQRRLTEQALEESERKFRSLAENIPGVVYLCQNDERRTTLYLNSAVKQLTGVPARDFLVGRVSFVELLHPDDAADIFPLITAAVAAREPFSLTYRLHHAGGWYRWVEERGQGVFDADGNLQYVEGTIFDITQRKRLDEEREQLVTQLQDALANVKQLRGMLPICASCKKIRDDRGYWERIEDYLHAHSDAEFSHAICPDCMRKLYPEFAEEIENEASPTEDAEEAGGIQKPPTADPE